MTTTTYCDEQSFLDYIKSGADLGNDVTLTALEGASRKVDSYCGRRFYAATETRYFSPNGNSESYWVLDLGSSDIATLTSLDVRTGTDGTYSTVWTSGTDYIAEPEDGVLNGIIGWPFTQLRALNTFWPLRITPRMRNTVKITGSFGWTDVPAPVKLATKLLAAQYYKLADAPMGVAGWGAYGDIRVRELPQVAQLLAPYRKARTFGIG